MASLRPILCFNKRIGESVLIDNFIKVIFSAKILRFHIKNNTPLFGKMLKTSCTADEVCITDAIPEVGEKYPNKHLDIIVESVRPPKFIVGENEFRIMMVRNK